MRGWERALMITKNGNFAIGTVEFEDFFLKIGRRFSVREINSSKLALQSGRSVVSTKYTSSQAFHMIFELGVQTTGLKVFQELISRRALFTKSFDILPNARMNLTGVVVFHRIFTEKFNPHLIVGDQRDVFNSE